MGVARTRRAAARAKHAPRIIVAAFLAMCLVFVAAVSVLSYVIDSNRGLARDGKEAHDAICVLKADYRERIREGVAFLREHPDGIPGIKVGVIKQSVKNQRQTLHALGKVRCKPVAAKDAAPPRPVGSAT